MGIGTAFNASDQSADGSTKGLGLSGNVGVNVDNQSGINPYADYQLNYKITTKKEREAEKELTRATGAMLGNAVANAFHNSNLEGLKSSTATFLKARSVAEFQRSTSSSVGASSAIDFNGFQPPAAVQIPMESFNFSASLEIGVHVYGATVSPGIEGSYSRQKLKDNFNEAPGLWVHE